MIRRSFDRLSTSAAEHQRRFVATLLILVLSSAVAASNLIGSGQESRLATDITPQPRAADDPTWRDNRVAAVDALTATQPSETATPSK